MNPAKASTGSITDVTGIDVDHFTDTRRPTGCSVIITRDGAVAGVNVRGAALGARETDLLHPSNLVDRVHAILLSGGSACGLDATSGVRRWLEENNIGLPVAFGLVTIVPAAVPFDFPVGNAKIRPNVKAAYAACVAVSRAAPREGNTGAGAGALVGKLFDRCDRDRRAVDQGPGASAGSGGARQTGSLNQPGPHDVRW